MLYIKYRIYIYIYIYIYIRYFLTNKFITIFEKREILTFPLITWCIYLCTTCNKKQRSITITVLLETNNRELNDLTKSSFLWTRLFYYVTMTRENAITVSPCAELCTLRVCINQHPENFYIWGSNAAVKFTKND